jgi:enoyl-CoA hydratase
MSSTNNTNNNLIPLTFLENGLIGILQFNRPERLNALSLELVDEFHQRLDELRFNETCRVVILTAKGKGFCSGADIRANAFGDGGRIWNAREILNQERFSSLVSKMRSIPQPIICCVQGVAAGGGMALALACDIRIVGESVQFIPSFLTLGLSGTEVATSYFLSKHIGLSNASYYLMSCDRITAKKCMELGLATLCVSDDELQKTAIEMAKRIISNSSRIGLILTKRQMDAVADGMSLSGVLNTENNAQLFAIHDEDARKFSQEKNAGKFNFSNNNNNNKL